MSLPEKEANHKPSEGEEFIMNFLNHVGIKFKEQVDIYGLKGDNRSHRRADFYLPDYKVYIEFNGAWKKKGEEVDQEYRFKKKVYEANKIPCVFLYPENIGFIYDALDRRLINCLKAYGMNKELRKYRIYKFKNAAGANVLIALLMFTLMLVGFITPEDDVHWDVYSLMSIILIYQLYRIWHYYSRIFREDKFSLFHQYLNA